MATSHCTPCWLVEEAAAEARGSCLDEDRKLAAVGGRGAVPAERLANAALAGLAAGAGICTSLQ
jgi:hypothetical protein